MPGLCGVKPAAVNHPTKKPRLVTGAAVTSHAIASEMAHLTAVAGGASGRQLLK